MNTETKVMGGIIAATVIILAIFAFASKPKQTDVFSLPQSVDTTGAVATGPENAPVTIMEFADFQCPACGQAHPIMKRILADYEGKVRYVHRHFPLTNIHKQAWDAAMASEAAKAQGKFWEMHDQLFSNQSDWANANRPKDYFEQYAKTIGLDMNAYREFIDGQKGKETIERDIKAGEDAKVDSTPTFFINGQGIKGVPSYNDLKNRIEEEIAKASPAS